MTAKPESRNASVNKQPAVYILASKRKWKLQLIESNNPNWLDLYHTIV
jgi:predicted GIY-YIG superfamily endonuclease